MGFIRIMLCWIEEGPTPVMQKSMLADTLPRSSGRNVENKRLLLPGTAVPSECKPPRLHNVLRKL